MKPLVSILIPAYNASQWLATTVRSAIGQTWDHKEIVIVDDGSTDDTLAIARSFEFDSIRVYTQKNQGAAATRNHAFEFSKGDYIQWLDADDLIGPDKVASQVAIAQQCQDKRILISGGWANFLYRHEHVNFVPTLLWADSDPDGMADPKDGAQFAHADGHLACQSRIDRSGRTLEYRPPR